jgi:hypothetical protein
VKDLEKEILEEFIEKCIRENHDIMPINKDHQKQLFKVLIQLTQSKIISIIDKRIEELEKNFDSFPFARPVKDIEHYNEIIEELESLKKEVNL